MSRTKNYLMDLLDIYQTLKRGGKTEAQALDLMMRTLNLDAEALGQVLADLGEVTK